MRKGNSWLLFTGNVLVKNFENRINSLNIGTERHMGTNLRTNGVDNAI